MGHRLGSRSALALLAASCWLWGSQRAGAQGQFDVFYVGSSQPIYDESGSNLLYGSASSPGCLVQIIEVTDTNNPVQPPFNPDGTVNASVQLLNGGDQTAIGMLTSPDLDAPGMFSYAAEKPPSGTMMYVRVFNSSNMFEATYYGDSQIFTMAADQNFDAVIPSTSVALSETDTDQDGLSDRLELSLGTNPYLADSDGDGVSDMDELLAGTDPLDANSYLHIDKWSFVGSDLVVEWASVPGVEYDIECTDDLTAGEDGYNCVSSVITANGATTQATIPGAADRPGCWHYRVNLTWP